FSKERATGSTAREPSSARRSPAIPSSPDSHGPCSALRDSTSRAGSIDRSSLPTSRISHTSNGAPALAGAGPPHRFVEARPPAASALPPGTASVFSAPEPEADQVHLHACRTRCLGAHHLDLAVCVAQPRAEGLEVSTHEQLGDEARAGFAQCLGQLQRALGQPERSCLIRPS